MRCIVEILGAPKDFIEAELRNHMKKVKEAGFNVLSEKYEEPVEKDNLFMQFVELEVSFKKLEELMDFCFESMPSSVEILSPDKMVMKLGDLEGFINDFQAKLHFTDAAYKKLDAEKKVLDHNVVNLCHNFILFACKLPQTLEDLSKLVGIKGDKLTGFVDHLIKKGKLKKEGDIFVAA